ncbi:MAG: hypothetical protein K2X67_16185 [Burkholderiales bacterium]|nr:hypothetical protein [Burkholderiales bacterium]
MTSRDVALAKFCRPRLHDAVPRERLYARLDALRQNAALVWIAGPPGAGKTTLAAGYLEARRLGGLWYQVDRGDLDLSTWFFHLRAAAGPLANDSLQLPLLTPEYRADIAGFARRWFRQLFAHLDTPSVLVLDNYQEASDSILDTVVSVLTAEIPAGITVILVSRNTPSAAFARATAHGDMAVLGWEELRLTLQEAQAIAATRDVLSDELVRTVWRDCEGWAAGCTLMLEGARLTGSTTTTSDLGSMETVFAYFAGLVFDALPDDTKRDLVLCNYLPTVSSTQASAMTGNPNAANLLDDFYRRHLFTNRTRAPESVYQFHALFRGFLRDRAPKVLTRERQRRALEDAAKLLMAAGQGSDALALYVEREDWSAVETAILTEAAALLAQGRGQTLRDWIGMLPDAQLERSPWARYWLGAALAPHDQQRARALLTRAYEHLHERDDFAGQVVTASGVVDTYFFSFSGYVGLAEWTPRIARLLEQVDRFTSPEQRLQACSSCLLASFFSDGAHPAIPACVEEMKRLIREPLDPNLRLRAGTFLVSYAGASLQPTLVRDDVELLEGLAVDRAVMPMRQVQWQIRYGSYWYQFGEFEQADARLTEAERLCHEHGLVVPASILNLIHVYVLTAKGDMHRATQLVDRWERMLTTERPVERSQLNVARLVTLLRTEERKREWPMLAREVAQQMDGTGQTWIRLANRIPGAYALIECGEHDTARQWVTDLRTILADTWFGRYERDVLLIEAYLALHENDIETARARVGRALHLTAEADIPLLCAQNARAFSRLLSFARSENIEPETANALAARYRLSLDVVDGTDTSARIRIMTLGRFALTKNGQQLVFKGKVQQRPLSLLKFLAAQADRGAAMSDISAALWPDSDGDLAANALKVTLHRLRKLLGNDEAIVVRQGSVFLEERFCWTDAHSFEDYADRAERLRIAERMSAFEAAAAEALARYQGHFLPAEEAAPWVVATRDRLARRARHLVLTLGRHLESIGRANEACMHYEAGLAADPLAEPLYQRLMGAHLSLGQHAEAMQVYRRCREMLSIVLGIAPCADTQALHRKIRQQDPLVDHP